MNNEGCPTQKVRPHPPPHPPTHYWDPAFICKTSMFPAVKNSIYLVDRVHYSFFQEVIRITDWCIHYWLHQALFFDELTVMIGWWTSGIFQKLTPKTPQLVFFTLKAAIPGIAFCTGEDHCSWTRIYYECPSSGCLQFLYYSLFEAFFVGLVGLLSHKNMTENCDPCESGQISNLIAMISKQNGPSARPCCPVLPRERLTRESRTQPKLSWWKRERC